MTMILIKHLPCLQVIIVLFGALFSALTFRNSLARLISIMAVGSSFALSLYCFITLKKNGNKEFVYVYGDWPSKVGIEYKLDFLNVYIIILINFILLFLLIFNNQLIKSSILEFIKDKKQHLFYSLILFAHTGYLGMLSTNDLFNLYVFIEISSLSAYVLMSQGNNPRAAIGGFDYLMLGSIGATLILIGIGFIFSYTGSLNMTEINEIINSYPTSQIIIAGSSFFLIGAILKMAFFPMHFWMIRAYSSTAPIILTYLATISTLIGIYIYIKLIQLVINYEHIYLIFSQYLEYFAYIAIIICAYFAYKSKNLKKNIIYSACAQIGYAILLLSIPGTESILFKFLTIDSINKIALFLLLAHYENGSKLNSNLWKIYIIATLVCSVGLPINAMFFMKLNILELLIQKNLWLAFFIVIISSAISFLYHFKIAKNIFLENKENFINGKNFINSSGLIFILLIQILMLYSFSNPYFDLKFSQKIFLEQIINA